MNWLGVLGAFENFPTAFLCIKIKESLNDQTRLGWVVLGKHKAIKFVAA
jgi:hypothetical protein